MVRKGDQLKSRYFSFTVAVTFVVLWLSYPLFKSYAGSPGLYVTTPWFYAVWSFFFVGGAFYLFRDALTGGRGRGHPR